MIEELERKNNSPRGITLVALVVTIVVLIILAVISINIIFGEDGIIEKTRISKQEMANAQAKEEQLLDEVANSMDKYTIGEREQTTVDKEEYETLKAEYQTLKENYETIKEDIEYLKERVEYPILYKNDAGWSSGSITIDGLSEYEEIGVYISIYTDDALSSAALVRCSRGGGAFSGSLTRIQSGNVQVPGVWLTTSGNTLTYDEGGKAIIYSGYNLARNTTKIYKIIGITKRSQIVE